MTALIQHSSVTSEHYSPPLLVTPARAVLGKIDLDPASCELANQTVRADRIYTREYDGLTRPWFGSVFLNPPGGRDAGGSVQKAWWWRAVCAWSNQEIEQLVFVSFNLGLLQTTQVESRGLLPLDFPICYPAVRVPYLIAEESGKTAQGDLFGRAPFEAPAVKSGDSPPQPSAVIFLPPHGEARRTAAVDRFFEHFEAVGRCVEPRRRAGMRAPCMECGELTLNAILCRDCSNERLMAEVFP